MDFKKFLSEAGGARGSNGTIKLLDQVKRKVEKGGGNYVNLEIALTELADMLDSYSNDNDENIYRERSAKAFKVLLDAMTKDELEFNNGYENR